MNAMHTFQEGWTMFEDCRCRPSWCYHSQSRNGRIYDLEMRVGRTYIAYRVIMTIADVNGLPTMPPTHDEMYGVTSFKNALDNARYIWLCRDQLWGDQPED
jgi:hypothetical protein